MRATWPRCAVILHEILIRIRRRGSSAFNQCRCAWSRGRSEAITARGFVGDYVAHCFPRFARLPKVTQRLWRGATWQRVICGSEPHNRESMRERPGARTPPLRPGRETDDAFHCCVCQLQQTD
ncbi:hypothetical protein SKAU_G00395810 [Synaphobranchus kaupii]|uniref:Uncharacterized protein n=1 Tax=Synaphobranchus kaupii TaxID=118154 RepID=A0A9Q1IC15_SYNKA|nr:hypothetical protein SKAU_G00395810 [Synaphobranchus kaupii]